MLYLLTPILFLGLCWCILRAVKCLRYYFTYRLPIDHKDIP